MHASIHLYSFTQLLLKHLQHCLEQARPRSCLHGAMGQIGNTDNHDRSPSGPLNSPHSSGFQKIQVAIDFYLEAGQQLTFGRQRGFKSGHLAYWLCELGQPLGLCASGFYTVKWSGGIHTLLVVQADERLVVGRESRLQGMHGRVGCSAA